MLGLACLGLGQDVQNRVVGLRLEGQVWGFRVRVRLLGLGLLGSGVRVLGLGSNRQAWIPSCLGAHLRWLPIPPANHPTIKIISPLIVSTTKTTLKYNERTGGTHQASGQQALGNAWERLGALGSAWEHLGPLGSAWEGLGAPGSAGERLGAPGNAWGAPGSAWARLGASGSA